MTKEDVKELLTKHTIMDVEFDHNTLILVLQGGRELVIESSWLYDESILSIDYLITERKSVGKVELG